MQDEISENPGDRFIFNPSTRIGRQPHGHLFERVEPFTFSIGDNLQYLPN